MNKAVRKIKPGDPVTQSVDAVAQNIELLKAVCPELITEGPSGTMVNVDVLKQLVGDSPTTDSEEKYSLAWYGKRSASHLALTQSTGTLLPCPEESVDWDTTKNLMIEGDNLEVLKLLQKSYAGKVKLIYIDPPYNTGKDFVYPDSYQNSIQNYLELTGQVEGGRKISSNTEANGRFHTDWLNMMYPRLKLARNLLGDDGVIFISINHRELANLVRMCDEVFGEKNSPGIVTWKARVKPVNIGEAKYRPQDETEYVVIYERNEAEGHFKPLYSGGVRSYPHELGTRKYRLQTILKSNRGANFRSTMSFEIDGYCPPEGQRWQAGEDEIKRLSSEGYLEFCDGTPFRRYFEDEESTEHDPFYCFLESEWSSTSEAGKLEVNALLGDNHGFDTVKPTQLIKTLIQATTSGPDEQIIMDFFAGSGTTGHAVMAQNAADNGNRHYILVQFPEPLSLGNKDQKTSAAFCKKLGKPLTISEITKERLRQAAKQIAGDNPGLTSDFGFRVFKLARSNIRSWDPDPDNLERCLEDSVQHLRAGRTEQDVLYELLLKLGLDLCIPVDRRTISGKTVCSIGNVQLLVCLCEEILAAEATALAQGIVAWRKEKDPAGTTETTCVFRDSAFESDVAKTNLCAVLNQRGINNIRSL